MGLNRDLVAELISDFEQIEDNSSLFRGGRNSAYQAVAIQLRNLLLKGPRALIARVVPGVTLHPLDADEGREEMEDGSIKIAVFGHATMFFAPTPYLELPVNLNREPIALAAWLEQWVIDSQIKIGKLINEAADQEVAHTQDVRTKMLERLSGAGFYFNISDPNDIGGRRPDRFLYQMMIVAIGDYVAFRGRELLAERSLASNSE